MACKSKKKCLYTKLEYMLTLYEITPKLKTCCQECEGTNNRCYQRKSNAQLIIFGGKYLWSLLGKWKIYIAKSIINYHQQSKRVGKSNQPNFLYFFEKNLETLMGFPV
jgi:hypothetical protein